MQWEASFGFVDSEPLVHYGGQSNLSLDGQEEEGR